MDRSVDEEAPTTTTTTMTTLRYCRFIPSPQRKDARGLILALVSIDFVGPLYLHHNADFFIFKLRRLENNKNIPF